MRWRALQKFEASCLHRCFNNANEIRFRNAQHFWFPKLTWLLRYHIHSRTFFDNQHERVNVWHWISHSSQRDVINNTVFGILATLFHPRRDCRTKTLMLLYAKISMGFEGDQGNQFEILVRFSKIIEAEADCSRTCAGLLWIADTLFSSHFFNDFSEEKIALFFLSSAKLLTQQKRIKKRIWWACWWKLGPRNMVWLECLSKLIATEAAVQSECESIGSTSKSQTRKKKILCQTKLDSQNADTTTFNEIWMVSLFYRNVIVYNFIIFFFLQTACFTKRTRQ